MKSLWSKTISLVVLWVLLGTGSYLFVTHFHPFGLDPWQIEKKILHLFSAPLIGRFHYMIFTISFWVALALTLTLERLMPARPNQKFLGLSFVQDLVWFFYEGIFHAFVIATYVSLLRRGYEKYFSVLMITRVNQIPEWAKFLFALLLVDFLYWLQHYLNHKVPLFWQFHKLHHSQTELNFFTDFRYHVLEYLVRETCLVIPFLILEVNPPNIIAFAIFQKWDTRFYHGNIRTNLGPLRHILVTPQSHRVHHSFEKRHCETNFGSLFCIWDFIFRVQYVGFDEYPETGIDDHNFPHEKSAGIKNLLLTPFRQMLYPFRVIEW